MACSVVLPPECCCRSISSLQAARRCTLRLPKLACVDQAAGASTLSRSCLLATHYLLLHIYCFNLLAHTLLSISLRNVAFYEFLASQPIVSSFTQFCI